MDCSAIVLNKILSERNIELWAKLKLGFLDSAYASVYSSISKYYDKYSNIPSFEELELVIREGSSQQTLAAIKLVDEPEISAEVALDALLDQYTQNETIYLLEKFVDKLPQYDTVEIKENLSNIVLTLDSKTITTEGVYNMADILLFQSLDDIAKDRVHLGLNNTFDSVLAGMARQELLLLGGPRGSGKSINCSNLIINQYQAGFSSVYFTIEMIAKETMERNMSILADVPFLALKQSTLTPDDLLKVIKARAGMFEDSGDLVLDFIKNRDRFKFEARLVKEKVLKKDNQIIIIDDRALTLTSLDLHLGKLKAQFGEKLTVCVVDYLNQIVIEGSGSQFDWQPQVIVSKKLKDLARKHNVLMISPYQIDAQGQARFAKGILDACDVALTMEVNGDSITYDTSKIRSGPPMKFTSPINWDTLAISPISIETPVKEEKPKKGKSNKPTDEKAADLPWDP